MMFLSTFYHKSTNMKRTIFIAAAGVATFGLITLAHAETLKPHNSYWIPPPECDKPYTAGPLIVVRGDEKLMGQLCPKTAFPVTLGCRVFLSGVPNSCFLVIAKDDLIEAQGWKYEQVRRHEESHCVGWGGDHKGARALDGRVRPETAAAPKPSQATFGPR